MPELPEVETFRLRFLHGSGDIPSLVEKRIEGVCLLWVKTLAMPSPKDFESRIIGQTIVGLGRRAKYLLFQLSRDVLVVHLRMSGDLLVESQADPILKHHRLLMDLDGGIRLAFNDVRKFGRVWLTDDIQGLLGHLGPEPLEDSFSPGMLFSNLQKRKRQIKPLLLDQHFLAGMGNIYTDEALFLAGIHPLTRADQIPVAQAHALWDAIREVLTEGIQRNGSSIDWVYRGGDFQNYFQVFRRTGEACYRCSTPIERIIVGQRSTHFCPKCQPNKAV